MSHANCPSRRQLRSRRGPSSGFTLIELLVTLVVFLLLGLAAMKLAMQSTGVSITQQAQSTLNVNVRNATAQIETDVINAGNGYFPAYNIPGAPVGIVVQHVGIGLDTLTILSFIPTVVGTPTGTFDTTSGTMTVAPYGSTTVAALQSGYAAGNELMMVTAGVNANDGLHCVTTVPLTHASASGSNEVLTFTPNATPSIPACGAATGSPTWAGDPLGISSTYQTDDSGTYGILQTTYNSGDYVLNTTHIIYQIASNVLTRTVYDGSVEVSSAVMANNVIGFQVGVQLYNDTVTNGAFTYASTTNTSYPFLIVPDPRSVRALRVSFITQTTPNAINPVPINEGTTVIINPRNLSMHD